MGCVEMGTGEELVVGDGGTKLPGGGIWGWMGRQVGYVTGAMRADVEKQAAGGGKEAAEEKSGEEKGAAEKVVYREEKVEEKALPGAEGVRLRRTVVDEVVVEGREEVGGEGKERQ